MLKTFIKKFRKNSKINNEKGQGMLEYILLVVVLVGIIVVSGPFLKDKVGEIRDNLGGQIGEVLGQ